MENSFKSGFVTIISRPNVGKSTLLNSILGQKIAITSPVAQTTRKQIKGIYTNDNMQIVFVDTPGVHKPLNELGKNLSAETYNALEGANLILFLVDATEPAGAGDKWIVENYLKKTDVPIILVLNKVDLIKNLEKREVNTFSYKKLFEPKNVPSIYVSAKTKRNLDDLISKIEDFLPIGEKYYDEDEVTDQTLRAIAAETIREKIIFNTSDEIPHQCAVLIEKYEEKENIDVISAKIIVSTSGQKGIIIGKNGSMLKKIGTDARLELERNFDKKIFLELFVSVQKNWQKDEKIVKRIQNGL